MRSSPSATTSSGHAVPASPPSSSDDFIRWEELPTALAPDSDYDAFGCFSGTAIENDGKHVLFYTGVVEEKLADGTKNVIQNQCMAVGDGISYEKISSNPVVDGKIMPEDCSRADFRDPKVWKDADGRYYMLAGNRTYDGIPQVVLFSSDDMYNWKFESVFAKDETGRFGAVWECPDYFEMNGHKVLIVSPQDMSADGEFHNGNNVVFFTGDVDEEKHIFKYEKAVSVDSGFDFYAPQTIRTPDGRRVMIGWMQSWDSVNTLPRGQKWACMMSVPRELMISDDAAGACVALGGSIVVYGSKPDGTAWKVGVKDPRAGEGTTMGVISFGDGETAFVSTSGDYEKYFEQDGRRYHHILDPRTGYPAWNGTIASNFRCPLLQVL